MSNVTYENNALKGIHAMNADREEQFQSDPAKFDQNFEGNQDTSLTMGDCTHNSQTVHSSAEDCCMGESPKTKSSRNRKTKAEDGQRLNECAFYYEKGYDPHLIAATMGVRISVVARLLMAYFLDPRTQKITPTKFLAAANTKVANIIPSRKTAKYYQAEFNESGQITLTPIPYKVG